MPIPYVLFDRDGTLIKHVHYLKDPNQVELMPGLIPGLIMLRDLGFLFGIVTNQSIIARGIGTVREVQSVNSRVCELLEEHGLKFSFTLFCPHAPSDSCNCRKPGIGLGIRAINEYDLDPGASFMIGDNVSDVIFGHALGCRSIQICGTVSLNSEAEFIAPDICSAAKWISAQLKEE